MDEGTRMNDDEYPITEGHPPPPPVNMPDTYLSMRLTIAHACWEKFVHVFDDVAWYISYPHVGSTGTNEHFHIFLPGEKKSHGEKFRLRLKDLGLFGNRYICIKLFSNGIAKGIQYASRENSAPYTKGPVADWIDAAPEWVDTRFAENAKKRKFDETEFGFKLSCFNLLYRAWEYREKKKVLSHDLTVVMGLMLNDGYCMDAGLCKGGAPDFYLEVFRESCEEKRLVWKPQTLKLSIFRAPRQTW